MGFEKFLFYVFAIILILAAVRVITVRNPVHAALFLVLAFFTSAALWLPRVIPVSRPHRS